MFGHILTNGVQDSVYVAHALGIAGQLELAGGIDGNEHYRGQYGDDADDDEHFYQGKTFLFVYFHDYY
jgi:hypothetical protein